VIFPESAFPPRGTAFDFGAAVWDISTKVSIE
jgi:hypothetical protein